MPVFEWQVQELYKSQNQHSGIGSITHVELLKGRCLIPSYNSCVSVPGLQHALFVLDITKGEGLEFMMWAETVLPDT